MELLDETDCVLRFVLIPPVEFYAVDVHRGIAEIAHSAGLPRHFCKGVPRPGGVLLHAPSESASSRTPAHRAGNADHGLNIKSPPGKCVCRPQRYDGTLAIVKTQNLGEAATKSEVERRASRGGDRKRQ